MQLGPRSPKIDASASANSPAKPGPPQHPRMLNKGVLKPCLGLTDGPELLARSPVTCGRQCQLLQTRAVHSQFVQLALEPFQLVQEPRRVRQATAAPMLHRWFFVGDPTAPVGVVDGCLQTRGDHRRGRGGWERQRRRRWQWRWGAGGLGRHPPGASPCGGCGTWCMCWSRRERRFARPSWPLALRMRGAYSLFFLPSRRVLHPRRRPLLRCSLAYLFLFTHVPLQGHSRPVRRPRVSRRPRGLRPRTSSAR